MSTRVGARCLSVLADMAPIMTLHAKASLKGMWQSAEPGLIAVTYEPSTHLEVDDSLPLPPPGDSV